MARDGWFDGKGLDLYRPEFVENHEGWKKYAEDGVISASEIMQQEMKITRMLRELEPMLSDDVHQKVTDLLLEYEVLVNMALVHYPTVMERPEFWSLQGGEKPVLPEKRYS